MKKRSSYLVIMLITIAGLLVCCGQNPKTKEEISIFDVKEAYDVAYKYLTYIKNDKIDKANSLCKEELLNRNKIINEGDTGIISFAKDDIKEGRNSAYITFKVVRGKEEEPKSDLDEFTIKVVKNNKEYKIEEVKSNTKKQVFLRKNSLRVIGEDGGDSNLLVRLTDLPKEVHITGNKIMLYKETTPLEKFGDVDLAYSGNLIGISTSAGNKRFLGLIIMEDGSNRKKGNGSGGIAALAPITESNIGEDITSELLDKPIAQKVIPLDILDGIEVSSFTFTPNNDNVIVSYIQGGTKRIKMYNATNGEIIKLDFDKIFPSDKYNINIVDVNEQWVFIEIGEVKDANKQLLGYYKVNIKSAKIEKLE